MSASLGTLENVAVGAEVRLAGALTLSGRGFILQVRLAAAGRHLSVDEAATLNGEEHCWSDSAFPDRTRMAGSCATTGRKQVLNVRYALFA
jgi:hypothetical protein